MHSEKRAARQRSPGASSGRRDKAAQCAASAPGMQAQHSGSGSQEPRITPSMAIAWRQQWRSAPQHGTGAGHAQAAGSRVGRAAQPGARLQARAPPAPALHLVERRPKCAEACHDATRAAAGCAARFGDPVSEARVRAARRRSASQRSRRLLRRHRSPSARAEQRGAERLNRAALEARSMTARLPQAGCVLSVFRKAARAARRGARQQGPQPAGNARQRHEASRSTWLASGRPGLGSLARGRRRRGL